ncbi:MULTISPECIES: serine hydrolase domain-containing protein [Streptomyces]|uniref:serine hydrolase domain-containing protein n=1 Tax=Streptomyces TaxID=1883 RepID=UPI00073DE08F|nr:serine hydrolase domain-containing protein [Streptomyces sp. EAS-AB2608]MYU27439.1 serine hydrolase [Streptomyces sp. SID7810]BCM72363.1 putative beta-lactamase, secreted [Streptomyces sp. EAS-AB2608]CUW26291.1 D-alanyl-D-alanine carboxypeptidase precursor [Streptomyces reticuli]
MTDQVAGGRASGPTRRRLVAGSLAAGGALALGALPAGPAAAAPAAAPASARRPTLRHGSPERAGLLPAHLRQLVTDAETFLGPSPKHPWYAGAVLLAGRGGTVALHEPIGTAVRYAGYDEKTDTGVELPPERQCPMTRDTVFDLASVSKLFTSILAVQQIERGALALEDTVASYLPDFGRAGKQDVTVRQLLTHTSGFRSWIPLYSAPTYEEKLRLVFDEAPVSPPGSAYLYSDLNLISLQLVLEKITGRALDTLLRDEITGPLGMDSTRYNPPASWKPRIAATEDARSPWSGLDRGLVWGEVHDENAYSLGGVAGHAGVFASAWDLAVLGRTLLNGGCYGRARILRPESVELMFTDFNTAFPGDEHGLGFELYQHWYMGALATPRTAGHTGFTGTSLVLDPTTDSFLIVLGNSVHPVRTWRSGSAPRVAAGNRLARAVPVRPARGRTAWFSGMANATAATLTLPALDTSAGPARLRCALWWDTEPRSDAVALESSADGGTTWQPVPFTTARHGEDAEDHPAGAVTGWSGRVWHRVTAALPAAPRLALRWRYTTDRLYVGRGAYVDALRVEAGGAALFDGARPADAARITAVGWQGSAD